MLRSKELGPTSAARTPDARCRIRFPPGSPRTDFWVSVGRVIEPAVCAVPPYEEMMLHELKDLAAELGVVPDGNKTMRLTWINALLPFGTIHRGSAPEGGDVVSRSLAADFDALALSPQPPCPCPCPQSAPGPSPKSQLVAPAAAPPPPAGDTEEEDALQAALAMSMPELSAVTPPVAAPAPAVVPIVTAPRYFGSVVDGIDYHDGLPLSWCHEKRNAFCPSSFGLVHGHRCSLCDAVIDLKLHSTICTVRWVTGRCVCLDSLVAKALLELPPTPSPVLRLPVWVVQSFLRSWPSKPSDPNWLQHFFSVDQAFSTQISGLDVLLQERSQLLQSLAGPVPVLCGAALESYPVMICQLCGDFLPTKCFSRRMLRWDKESQMVCKMCVMRWGEDPSIKFARFWLQAWFLWWTHCTRHSGFVDLPPFDILDFKPWYYLEGDAPFCEDDDMDDFECDDIWGSYDSQNVG
jgi:hypothetical protein